MLEAIGIHYENDSLEREIALKAARWIKEQSGTRLMVESDKEIVSAILGTQREKWGCVMVAMALNKALEMKNGRIKEFLERKRADVLKTVKHIPCHRIELLDKISEELFNNQYYGSTNKKN